MSLLCVATTCRPMRAQHADGCTDERCRGCLPKLADPPLQVCAACRLRIHDRLRELSGIYEDLLTPTKIPGSNGKHAASTERPQTLGDDAVKARNRIRVNIVGWCLLLEEEHHTTLPADTVPAMVAHLLAHTPRVLATQHAQRFADEIDDMWTEGRRRAYPSPPLGHVIGHCPLADPTNDTQACDGDVRAVIDTLDGQGWATCMRCRETAVITWWQENMPAEHPDWMGMRDLRWHLSIMHMQHVPEGTIKSWSSPRSDDTDAKLPTRLIVGGRVQYHVDTAVELAQSRRPRRATG